MVICLSYRAFEPESAHIDLYPSSRRVLLSRVVELMYRGNLMPLPKKVLERVLAGNKQAKAGSGSIHS